MNEPTLGQLNIEKGKTPLLRIMWVYRHMWKKQYGTPFIVDSWGKYGAIVKRLLNNFNEMQISALIVCMFNWYGSDGNDIKEHEFVEGAFFPFGMISSAMNKYIAYIVNVEGVDWDDVESVKSYVVSNI